MHPLGDGRYRARRRVRGHGAHHRLDHGEPCGSSFDTVLYVSTTCGNSAITCSDDSCGTQSSVTWSTTAGTTYYLVVDGYNTASGTYTLNITGY